jgi:hypothetical protein
VTRMSQALGVAAFLALTSMILEPVLVLSQSQDQAQEKSLTPSEVRALEAKAEAAQEEKFRLTPLSVDIVVSRFQGDKKVSSLPYTLAVNANELAGNIGGGGGIAQLRMGANVPVPSLVAPKDNPGSPAGPLPGPVNYQDIGTSIDCNAQRMKDGGFQLRISVQDTSVYTNIQDKTTPTVGEMPVFRKLSSTNMLVMKDGQTREFTAATDRVSGEVVRIAVTLRVVK